MRAVLLALAVLAVGTTPMPQLGSPAERALMPCAELNIMLEYRAYNYNPPHPKFWQAHGVAKQDEADFAVVVYFPKGIPEGEPTAADSLLYIDGDLDGKAEEVIPFVEAIRRFENSWCVAYSRVRAGR